MKKIPKTSIRILLYNIIHVIFLLCLQYRTLAWIWMDNCMHMSDVYPAAMCLCIFRNKNKMRRSTINKAKKCFLQLCHYCSVMIQYWYFDFDFISSLYLQDMRPNSGIFSSLYYINKNLEWHSQIYNCCWKLWKIMVV